MQRPYIKKLDTLGDVNVFEVDGNYVRGNLNKEFTNFAQHYAPGMSFIPKNEFWVDHGFNRQEVPFFLDNLMVQHRLQEQGVPYGKAYGQAVKVEKHEREKAAIGQRIGGMTHAGKINKRPMAELSSPEAKAYLVDGKAVRDHITPNFTEGGNDKAYPKFIPKGEVWIDDATAPKERPLFALHEHTERHEMSKGKSYEEAHRTASRVENEHRKKKVAPPMTPNT